MFSMNKYGYCYSLRESKYLNGPDMSSWSIVLVRKITIDVDYKIVFKLWFEDAVSTCR